MLSVYVSDQVMVMIVYNAQQFNLTVNNVIIG